MGYEFKGHFTERKPGIVVCSFCQMLSSMMSDGGRKLEEKDSLLWREHLKLRHGWVAEESLPC